MPIYTRQTIRREFSQKLNDIYIGMVGSGQGVAAAASVYFLDPTQTDPGGSGLSQDFRAYVLHAGVTYRVGSFNFPSGSWVTAQLAATTVGSGDSFEVHRMLSPADKNLCIDRTVSRFRQRREVGFTSTDTARNYDITSAASPQTIKAVLESYYWANMNTSLGTSQAGVPATGDRDERYFTWFGFEPTATGLELRIRPAIAGSMQIVMDAILDMTLGSGDAATISLPSDQWVIWGAINQALDLVIQRSPSQEAGRYKERRMEAAAMWNKLNALYMPLIDYRISYDEDPQVKLRNSPGA